MVEHRAIRDAVLPERGFMPGIARLFDFSGSLDRKTIERIRRRHHNPPAMPSAEEAIRSTWQSVGDNMRWAIGQFEKASSENAPSERPAKARDG